MAECPAPEWLIEEGIGETRALLVSGERVFAAKVFWPGELHAGLRVTGRLTAKLKGTRRGVALLVDGTEALVDHLPPTVTEGQALDLVVTRAPLAERGRVKRAQARIALVDSAAATSPVPKGRVVRRFASGLWEDVWQSASEASLAFSGGEVLVSVTPAMTLIDIDGIGTPRDVALAAIPAITRSLMWFDIAGNIGIDFPTIAAKADRRAIDEALDSALAGWTHERTAMNGFGFVQLVARLEGPSLLHRFATTRLGAAARMTLRKAELAADGGIGRMMQITVHPAVRPHLQADWIETLTRRTGREVRIDIDTALAIESGSAQLLSA
ncbi:ribonuclease [Erythrobacter sp. R86502]|uniref:ribonuclease n=1 Tax=Erythrobacter sp. R86502 TaxID=3093846 RepID=UPI0036D43834